MKKRNITIGLILIFAAIVILLDAFGIILSLTTAVGGLSVISILFGILLIALSIHRIMKHDFSTVIIAVALIFMLFEKNIAFILSRPENIINNWLLLLASVILAIGVKYIIPKSSKAHSIMFGESTVYLNSTDFNSKQKRHVKNKFGECKIYFENCDEYTGDGTLSISNRFGEMRIFVPSTWRLVTKVECAFGESNFPKCDGTENAPVLNIIGSNKFGELKIVYI